MSVLKFGELWHVDVQTALETAFHEALVRQAYYDSEDVLTWNVGMTDATGHRVSRYINNPQTLQHCMNLYAWALERYADRVRRAFKGVKISKAQFAAALSFDWNTGAILKAKWVAYFCAGDVVKARKAFMNYSKPKSIIKRRKAEKALFFDGKWSNNGTITEYTKVSSALQPVWSSAVKIDIRKELTQALMLGGATTPKLDQDPNPDNVPKAPTLTPAHSLDEAIARMDLKTPGHLDLHGVKPAPVTPSRPEDLQTALKKSVKKSIKESVEERVPASALWAAVMISVGTVLFGIWEWLMALPCNLFNIACGG